MYFPFADLKGILKLTPWVMTSSALLYILFYMTVNTKQYALLFIKCLQMLYTNTKNTNKFEKFLNSILPSSSNIQP